MTEMIVSNATSQNRECAYRMPGEKERIFKFRVGPYAINQKLSFPSEAHLKEYKRQNSHLFGGAYPVFVEGRQIGSRKLKHVNEGLNKELNEKVAQEIEEHTNQVAASAEEATGRKIEIKVERVERKKRK